MRALGIETRIFRQGENLFDFLEESLKQKTSDKKDPGVLVVTSKLLSLAEGRIIPRTAGITKAELIRKEAELDLGPLQHSSRLTLKHGLLLPSAGIDESNSETGGFILLPTDPWGWAKKIHLEITQRLNRENLGVVITDSRSQPLRRGISGVALGYAGFRGLINRVGQKDLFGRPLSMTQINSVDPLAAIAVLEMGEANESKPLVWIEETHLEFLGRKDTQDFDFKNEIQVNLEQDMYAHQINRMREPRTKTTVHSKVYG